MSNERNINIGTDALVILIMIGALVFLLWYFGGSAVMGFLFKVSPYILSLYDFAPDILISPEIKAQAKHLVHKLPTINPEHNRSFTHLSKLMAILGIGLRIFLIPVFAYYAYKYSKPKARSRYTRLFTLKRLVTQNRELFPAVDLYTHLNLHKGDQYHGPVPVARTCIDFCLDHELLYREGRPLGKAPKTIYGPRIKQKREYFGHFSKIHLDKEKCDRIFVEQLGKPWRGADALPPLIKALYAAFCARVVGGEFTDKGNKLIDQIARTIVFGVITEKNGKTLVTPHKADISGTEELIEATKNEPRIVSIRNSHAFESTVLFALLSQSRRTGKLAPALFKWLRVVNRTLWYSLHYTGGRKPWAEGMATWAHYHCELDMKAPIKAPTIEGATDSLEHDLHKEQWLYVAKWGERDKAEEAARQAADDLLSQATDQDREIAAKGLSGVLPKDREVA